MMIGGVLIELGQIILAIFLAPLLLGLMRLVKARLQGRRGAAIWQPYYDIAKLLGKEVVRSTTSSWIFTFTPYIQITIMLVAVLLSPLLFIQPSLGFTGDIIVLMYIFLLATFFLALAGLDTGSGFGGMGASREMIIAALAEPTIMLAIFAIALPAGSSSLSGIVLYVANDPLIILNPGHLLAFAAFFIVMIAETGRLPVDNPTTHLELTMIHEAMVLEYSGRHLALVEMASALKFFLFLGLLSNLFLPWGIAQSTSPGSLIVSVVALVLKMSMLAIGIAVLESVVAKLRLFRVSELMGGSFALAMLSLLSFLFLR